MRLVRYGAPGEERPGLIDASGVLRDLSDLVDDIAGFTLSDAGLARIRAEPETSRPRVEGAPRLGPPVGNVSKFIGIGLNYADHAAEAGVKIPREPVLFSKAVSCIAGPHDDIVLPPDAQKADFEVELAIVIGRRATRIAEKDAIAHVAGYCLCIDLSERAWQFESTGQFVKGKSADSFGPLGPYLVTRDAIPDPQCIDLTLDVNGATMQNGSTSRMIFPVATLVAYVSRFMTLMPGDVIATGTPAGVGTARKPQVFLKEGDAVVARGGLLGEMRKSVVRASR
jgi:2,4-diketo-3-deoxy-L-fuconate hydrolase